MGILIFHTIISLPMYMIVPAILDSSYEFFQTCLQVLTKFYVYGIIIIGLYIAYYILMKKEKKFIVCVITTTVIFAVLIYWLGGFLFKEREKPDNLYLTMKEFNDNNNIVGLSKEEVVELLGEPMEMSEYSNSKMDIEYYIYSAGNIYVGIIWGDCNIFTTRHSYRYSVCFDETDKVKSTSMREDT